MDMMALLLKSLERRGEQNKYRKFGRRDGSLCRAKDTSDFNREGEERKEGLGSRTIKLWAVFAVLIKRDSGRL